MRKILLQILFIAGFACAGDFKAVAAPTQLYGKSVVVTWTEERNQRVKGEEHVRNVGGSGQFSVYLSAAGRPFSRMSYTFSRARGGAKTGAKDAVGGESSGGNRSVTFQGNAMSVGISMRGGAKRILVNFENGFQSCSAQVLTGKAEGADRIHAKSMISGQDIEIVSVKTGPAGCRVQDGNIFGN